MEPIRQFESEKDLSYQHHDLPFVSLSASKILETGSFPYLLHFTVHSNATNTRGVDLQFENQSFNESNAPPTNPYSLWGWGDCLPLLRRKAVLSYEICSKASKLYGEVLKSLEGVGRFVTGNLVVRTGDGLCSDSESEGNCVEPETRIAPL
jgi:hypothetical protein